MMRLLVRFSILLFAVVLFSSCGQKSADLQESAVSPDKTLYENGMKFFEKSYFIKARLSFQTLINTYPDSEYTPAAFLATADSFYKEGGTENLLQAEAQYKDFIIFYPNHEMADDAQLKIAAINVKLMKPSDRDPTYARKAEVEFKKFLENYPDSELAPTAQEFLHDVQENRAASIQDVANFYLKMRKNYMASESRYKEVISNYPDFSRADEALYNLGLALENMGRIEEASVYYSRVASEYPFSAFSEDAKDKLILLEKPVPAVNQEVAAKNEANRRVESFSIFDPLRSVWATFAGGEDPYEVARRRAEERKNQQTNPAPVTGPQGQASPVPAASNTAGFKAGGPQR
ncbi:MAG: outer membrane protein assembly factor BamD [Acidobacteria bacterium]|nr:MAG: outer membrane protein assembly factor BamD [Acidobacteriota bacterium]